MNKPATDTERKVLEVYKTLKELCHDEAPCVKYNARRALAAVWQIVNDLGLEFEQLHEHGA
ncbi:MAG: hypothetical protein ACE5H9_13600 [Anaerolineae bacterium]